MGKGRSLRRTERWKKKYDEYHMTRNQIKMYAQDILNSRNFHKTKEHIQHGNITVNRHVMDVACCSILLSKKLRIRCSQRELIRGALLHDYFLYDWHIPDEKNPHKLHGFYHPGRALRNAMAEYDLTEREKDIIKKHMWPLTFIPPMCREAWIVTAADKWCSSMETLHLRKGHSVYLGMDSEKVLPKVLKRVLINNREEGSR